MRKLLLILLLPLTLVSNAKEKDVEKILGTYWNSFSNRSLQVSAIVDENDELKLFLEIPVYVKNVEKMKLEIEEENIPLLRAELLRLKDTRWKLYTKFKEDGRNYYITDLKEIEFPSMRVKWLIDDKWYTSKKDECTPIFEILNGRYMVYINQPIVERITGKQIALAAGAIAVAVAVLILSDGSEIEAPPLDISDPMMYNTPPSSTDSNIFEYRWGFSTQDDIKAVINWLDIEKLKSKYKAKK